MLNWVSFILSLISLVVTIGVAYGVYLLQDKKSTSNHGEIVGYFAELQDQNEELREAVRQALPQPPAELVTIQQDPTPEDEPEVSSTGPRPPATSLEDFLGLIREASSAYNGDPDSLKWAKKVRCGTDPADKRGNLGWFVDIGNGDERWFLHKGGAPSIREALPRKELSAWEAQTKREPCQIEYEYPTEKGWVVTTYAGEEFLLRERPDHTVAVLDLSVDQ